MVLNSPRHFQRWLIDLLGLEQTNESLLAKEDFDSWYDPSRDILWIVDETGNNGKSIAGKLVCYRKDLFNAESLPLASPSQLRECITKTPIRSTYILDIPRTTGVGEELDNVISTIEELKNGKVTSYMRGQRKDIYFDPLKVIIFSNSYPDPSKMSHDRWRVVRLTKELQDCTYEEFLIKIKEGLIPITELCKIKFEEREKAFHLSCAYEARKKVTTMRYELQMTSRGVGKNNGFDPKNPEQFILDGPNIISPESLVEATPKKRGRPPLDKKKAAKIGAS